MPNIAGGLVKLVQRLSTRASRGVVMYGARELSVAAVKEIDITVGGIRICYKNLIEQDQKAVDEIVKYTLRLTDQYAQHHEEYKRQRQRKPDLTFEEYFQSHADEIVNAAVSAAIAHGRSAVYDRVIGKPKFASQIWAKEYVNAFIDDYCTRVR